MAHMWVCRFRGIYLFGSPNRSIIVFRGPQWDALISGN